MHFSMLKTRAVDRYGREVQDEPLVLTLPALRHSKYSRQAGFDQSLLSFAAPERPTLVSGNECQACTVNGLLAPIARTTKIRVPRSEV